MEVLPTALNPTRLENKLFNETSLAGNAKGGSITVLLTRLTALD
jgi:hypothetical protein